MNKTIVISVITMAIGLTLSAASCNQKGKENAQRNTESHIDGASNLTATVTSPFKPDSALNHIKRQVEAGPRVPNTPAHRATSEYLYSTLERYGMKVYRQEMTLTAYDGTALEAVNIVASHNPDAQKRVLLFAHWDTRPFADYDHDPNRRKDPILGADDGASGVGVLLEIARLLQLNGFKNIGVDIALFDAEDYGVPHNVDFEGDREGSWALGTQYWAKHPVPEGYNADFGILLDMVGAKNATFYREYYSQESAGRWVTNIWEQARSLGHGRFFINEMGGAITDDHTFVIRNLRIPCVDIINYDPNSETGFGSYWHTHADNLDNISLETLKAVGETVWSVLAHYDKSVSNN